MLKHLFGFSLLGDKKGNGEAHTGWGFQSLVGTQAEVVSRLASDGSIKYLVRSQGELWTAYSTDILDIGELVNIVSLKGIDVVVERVE